MQSAWSCCMVRLRRSRQRRGRCRRRRSWARVHGRRAPCKRSRCSWKLANPTESCAGMAKVSSLAADPRDNPPAHLPTCPSPHRFTRLLRRTLWAQKEGTHRLAAQRETVTALWPGARPRSRGCLPPYAGPPAWDGPKARWWTRALVRHDLPSLWSRPGASTTYLWPLPPQLTLTLTLTLTLRLPLLLPLPLPLPLPLTLTRCRAPGHRAAKAASRWR